MTSKGCSSVFALVFGVLWTVFMLIFDALWARGLLLQARSREYLSTTGTVTESRLVVSRSSSSGKRPSTTTSARIRYRYSVNGQEYTGLRSGDMEFGTKDRDSRLVKSLPVGAAVTVFYDPKVPATSLLDPGLKPGHLAIVLFLLPFHLIPVLILAPVLSSFRPGKLAASPLRSTGELQMKVRMPRVAPWYVGSIGVFIASLVALFGLFGSEPLTMQKLTFIATAVLGAGLAFGAWQAFRLAGGGADLTIDAQTQTITLPTARGRRKRISIPFHRVHGISLEHLGSVIVRKSKWGTVRTSYLMPQSELSLVGPDEALIPLALSGQESQLRAIAHALRDTFGWPLSLKGFVS